MKKPPAKSTKPKKKSTPEVIEFVPVAADKQPEGEPRYRDPRNPFNTWSGRGKAPPWLQELLDKGRKLEDFEIK
jgi:DNA-binding protein H-NS